VSVLDEADPNKPCAFCGGKCDPHGWLGCGEPGTPMQSGPECETCGATTPDLDTWNRRVPDWRALYVRMRNIAAGYSQHADENGSTRRLDREFEQVEKDAR